ncbi:hypothetical protein [Sessilibacter corallicola]|uniref:Transposase InsH N-terminal domain-containing protein n=1 Tax=Sessilibacter corallicola TaxID=2904075 RepID=A0ABQ0A9P9_9GAMM
MCSAIEPFHPKFSKFGGRGIIGIGHMLCIYFLQHWFEFSDPAEEAFYDIRLMREFVGIDLI